MLVETTPGGKFPTKRLRLMHSGANVQVTCGSKQRRLSCMLVPQWQLVPYSHIVKCILLINTYSLSSAGLCAVAA